MSKHSQIVLAFGTFDLLHPGHKFFLKQCREKGDKLVVLVARDKTVKHLKGSSPIHSETERMKNIKNLKIADLVLLGKHNHKKRYDILEMIRPDIICLGYDQKFFVRNLNRVLKRLNLKAKIIRIKTFKPNKYKSSILRKNKKT
jgi:FAD synthetase